VWLIDNSTVVTNNDNIHVPWRVIGTAVHNALLVFTHNYALFRAKRGSNQVQLRFWWWSMDIFGLIALVALYCNGLASNSWYVLVG